MNVVIVGVGLIGGSVALELKESGFATTITGIETDSENAAQALKLGLVDRLGTLEESIPKADLVVISTPVNIIEEMISPILSLAGPQTTVSDFGSTKESITSHISKHPKREQYVPAHPMAGTENSGPQAAIKNLFRGKTAVICDRDQSGKQHLQAVEKVLKLLGMRCLYMNSKEHDRHVAFVSHLSHISSFILANTVLDIERDTATIFDLASGGFESTVRLGKSSPEMWAPIFEQNKKNVLEALEAYIRHLEKFRNSLSKENTSETRSILSQANGIRRVLDSINKGKT